MTQQSDIIDSNPLPTPFQASRYTRIIPACSNMQTVTASCLHTFIKLGCAKTDCDLCISSPFQVSAFEIDLSVVVIYKLLRTCTSCLRLTIHLSHALRLLLMCIILVYSLALVARYLAQVPVHLVL